jgi:hypothetical protein
MGKKHQDETAHDCIEGFVAGDLAHIGLDEAHILQAGLGHASPGPGDRAHVAFYAHHLSRRTNQVGR